MKSSGNLRWFDGASANELALWEAAWSCTDERRPHWHPAFVTALAPRDREPATVHYTYGDAASVLYPFWVGSLARLPHCPSCLRDGIDLLSPYGYGGPSYNGPPTLREEVERGFRSEFAAACRDRRVVSEFVREDLFQDHLVADEGERIYRQRNVIVRLGLSESDHLKRFEHKVRKNVRRARSEGLTFLVDETGRRLDEFLSVYSNTMARTGASSYFSFPHEVFKQLEAGLAPGRGLVYFHVLDGESIVSTELVLLSRTTMYSFLGGTEVDSMPKRPNDLLKHEAILWGGRNGFQWFVLGGGAEPEDGIYQYKKAFDPESVLPFYTRQRIHDPLAYDALARSRRAVAPSPDEQFFPIYRG